MSTQPMPTRTRIATFVVALAATAIGFLTPPASVGDPGVNTSTGTGQTAGVHSR